MSSQDSNDPRLEQATATDESIISAHEKASEGRPDVDGSYRLMPLVLLFVFSGFIFFGGTYLHRYTGYFSPEIFDERQHAGGPVVEAPKIDPVVFGKKKYDLACVTCHMPNGLGVPGAFPPLVDSEWVDGSEDRLIAIVLHGLKGPLTVNGKTYGAAAMPAFGQGSGYNWKDVEIAAVLTYIRQEWGNTAGPIETASVTAFRERGDRKEWTEAELLKLP